jgi:hypothetical protein
VVTVGAYGAGQLLVFNFDARNLTGFAFAAMIASLAVIPVSMSEQAATPNIDSHEHITLRELARVVPTGVGTILLVGLAHGGMLGMAVIYATREGLSVGRIGVLVAAVQLGGMALTWPISSASDDLDRRIIGLLIAIGAIVMGAAATGQLCCCSSSAVSVSPCMQLLVPTQTTGFLLNKWGPPHHSW